MDVFAGRLNAAAHALLILAGGVLSGCINANLHHSASVDALNDAVASLNVKLGKVVLISESDLLGDEDGYRFKTVRKIFRDKQCATGISNPVLLLARPASVSLRGKLGGAGSTKVSDPAGDYQGGPRAVAQDSFEVPLLVSTIADLPNEYLKDMVALTQTAGLPAEISGRIRAEIPANYEKLKIRVNALIDGYIPEACAPESRPQSVRWQPGSAIIFLPPTF